MRWWWACWLLACGVERDLAVERFGCAQGGPCPVDAGVALNACAGSYTGDVRGGEIGQVLGSLSSNGRISLTFYTANFPTGVVVAAQISGATVSGEGVSGSFEATTCSGDGTWTTNGRTATWTLERE